MPTTTYSEDEYLALLNEKRDLERKVDALESLRPVWAQGFTSDSRAAQTWASAAKQLWDLLGVRNQTEAVLKLRAQSTPQPADVRADQPLSES